MRRIAAICAYPHGLNPGMLSVDLGLVSVLAALPGKSQLTLYDPRGAFEVTATPISLVYQPLNSLDELMQYDCVIYWGDFTHWLRYAKWDWLVGDDRRGADAAALLEQWYRIYLLEHDVERFRGKLIVYGNSLYGLSAADLVDSRYKAALKAMYGAASLVMPRDQVSASIVEQLCPQQAPALGCDCAFLLDPEMTLPMGQAEQAIGALPQRFLACSFGRSGEKEALTRFARALAEKLGLQVMVFDWLGAPSGLPGLAAKTAMLRRAAVLVTDVYHLAVSGFRDHVPTIGIGRARSYAGGTLDDKKKEILFRQMMASDYYFYLEDILDTMHSSHPAGNPLAKAVSLLHNRPMLDQIDVWLQAQVGQARQRLVAAISVCTDGPF